MNNLASAEFSIVLALAVSYLGTNLNGQLASDVAANSTTARASNGTNECRPMLWSLRTRNKRRRRDYITILKLDR